MNELSFKEKMLEKIVELSKEAASLDQENISLGETNNELAENLLDLKLEHEDALKSFTENTEIFDNDMKNLSEDNSHLRKQLVDQQTMLMVYDHNTKIMIRLVIEALLKKGLIPFDMKEEVIKNVCFALMETTIEMSISELDELIGNCFPEATLQNKTKAITKISLPLVSASSPLDQLQQLVRFGR